MGWVYECRLCGKQQPAEWIGPCSNCGRYCNAVRRPSDDPGATKGVAEYGQMVALADVEPPDVPRVSVGIKSIDRVIGGRPKNGYGFAAGQTMMLDGSPGAGKSTLILQLLANLAYRRKTALYVAGEESVEQIRERADVFGFKLRSHLQVLPEHDLDAILDALEELHPAFYVVDSIQTITFDDYRAGSAAAILEAAGRLRDFSKQESVAGAFVVQIAKDGTFSGPKGLEHLVDTAMRLRWSGIPGEPRILSLTKNRYGIPCEAYLEMVDGKGMVDVTRKVAEGAIPAPTPESPPTGTVPESTGNPAAAWTGPNGMTADKVLAEPCDEPGCHGKTDRACTAENGARQVGFHPSRIAKAQGKPKLALVPDDDEDDDPPPSRPLGGPPRVRGGRAAQGASACG